MLIRSLPLLNFFVAVMLLSIGLWGRGIADIWVCSGWPLL